MSAPHRRRNLWLLLAAAAAAAAVAASLPDTAQETVAAAPARASAPRATAPAADTAAWPTPATRSRGDGPAQDAVRFEGWEPPPPPPPAPRAAAPARAFVGPTVPTVPPFGYTLVGRVEEGVTARAVLHSELRSLSVAAGDVIDGQWQVEAVEATQLTLLWMPTRRRQVVAMAQK